MVVMSEHTGDESPGADQLLHRPAAGAGGKKQTSTS
jgi:hypothetical protein